MRPITRKGKKRRDEVNVMKSVFSTDRGQIRQQNEDNGGIFRNHNGQILAVVADGMGGHQAGDVASRMSTHLLQEKWEETTDIGTPDIAESWFTENVAAINEHLFRHAQQHSECSGMGTTLVAAICTNRFVTIIHIGDSRCYLLNEDGFKQLTEDHTLVNELVKTGEISKEAAEHHPRKNWILKALGTETTIEADVKTITFEHEDLLLLCSDGLTNELSEQQIKDVLSTEQELDEKACNLIRLANEQGGEDNITVAIVQQVCGESG